MIYAIGDIHGQISMLNALLDMLHEEGFEPGRDTLLFLGDYIDRGEDSRATVERMLEIQREYPDTIFLRGNHEQMLLDARDGELPTVNDAGTMAIFSDATLLWLQNGGMNALDSYGGLTNPLEWWEMIPDAHWDFFRSTCMEHITPQYHFVHAGLLPPGARWEGEPHGLDPRLWVREPFLHSRHDFEGRVVVFGHTPQQTGRPLIQRNKIGLDTGAVFGGNLTAGAFDVEMPLASSHPRLFQVGQMP
jgi:serine/threonine protein phosphatase 1